MKTKLIIGISALLILVAFQNCGQPGSVQLTSDSVAPQKLASDATPQEDPPLVVDVVAAIDEIKAPAAAPSVPPIKESDDKQPTSAEVALVPAPAPQAGEMSADDGVVIPAINNVEEVLADHSCGERGQKVLVCHFPPGNPSAMHTICIGRAALKAHMKHGHSAPEHQDHVGACQ